MCKTQTQMKTFADYGLLVMMGIFVGMAVGCFLWCGANGVHTTVREIEVSLAKMRQWADRSMVARAIVEKSLGRIKACIEKEMLNVMHSG